MEHSFKKTYVDEPSIDLNISPVDSENYETYDIIIIQSHGDNISKINVTPLKNSLSKVTIKIFTENQASVDCVCTVNVGNEASGVDTDVQFRSWPFDNSRVQARPEMFIHNGDIKAAHGNALGTLSDEDQYYLNTRGIVDYKEIIKRSLMHEE